MISHTEAQRHRGDLKLGRCPRPRKQANHMRLTGVRCLGWSPSSKSSKKLCGSVPLCENSTATFRMKSRGKQMLDRDAIRRGRVLPLLSRHGPIGFSQWPNWLRSMAKRSRAHAQRKVLASLLHCFGVNSQQSWRQLNRVLTPTRRAVHRRKRGWPQAESAWPQEDSGLAT